MPTTPVLPGVFVEEVSTQMRTITGAETSIAAFIGRALKGPVDDPTPVRSFGEFVGRFGGLWRDSTMSYAVQHFFANGGSEALIVRVAEGGARAAEFALSAGAGSLRLRADGPGSWGDRLQLFVDHDGWDASAAGGDVDRFNLVVQETDEGGSPTARESFVGLSTDPAQPTYVETVLEQRSGLVRVHGAVPSARPDATPLDSGGDALPAPIETAGDDGGTIGFDEIAHPELEAQRRGLWALRKADSFNLLCIPPFTETADTSRETWEAAVVYCRQRRAMLIVDPPSTWSEPADVLDAATGIDGNDAPVPPRDANAMIYFPRVRMADPERDNQLATFAPCGVIAGLIARTDGTRGVWKAPAGMEARLGGVRELTHELNDAENGLLNPLAINCLRQFPVHGTVAWGARTTAGADSLASEWKYIPVRRLALFLEESLDRGLQWVVFEPNDEPVWQQIRLAVGAFLHDLFRQGAFQGAKPSDAYFVKCDTETTTQSDRDLGIVNLVVGFAPLKPAEFVVLKLQFKAGESRPAMAVMVQAVASRATWRDLELPTRETAIVRDFVAEVRRRIADDGGWGAAAGSVRRQGVSALFSGPSGTGKTMAAKVLANELGHDLWKIDLSAVVSKYIGETEKNLGRVFDAAEAKGGAVLLFDEADALFGKRTEVSDSHDRYANLETNYVIQRMATYPGLVILTTSRKSRLDPGWLRQVGFCLDLPDDRSG